VRIDVGVRRGRPCHVVAGLLAAALIATVIQTASAQGPDGPPPAASRTVWDGVYNLAQAARGETSYSAHCANCHRDDLTGYDGLLRGQRFMDKYREAGLHLLFEKTRTTMPRNAAGSLSDETYTDIIGYVLKANGFPAGADELHVDELANIKLLGKGGPEPVPEFSLVQIAGCLVRRDNVWMVTNSTEPVRTGRPQPTADEIAAWETPVTGSGTVRLLVSAGSSPGTHENHLVEVRGFLFGRPQTRINPTSIETLGPACGP
jgi:mono/diheme cytochrome c family protein